MRRVRRLVISWPRVLLLALSISLSVVSWSDVQLAYADHQTSFFTGDGFVAVGIDFGFRLNVPPLANEPRMYVTRPLVGNPRQLRQRDADASGFSLRAALSNRPSGSFADNLAVIPAVLGTQEGQTTAGGFTPNDILVTQRLKVFRISGAGTGSVTPMLLTTIPSEGDPSTQCTSSNSRIAVDRWTLQFGGRAIFTCTGVVSETENVTEIWLIGLSGGAVNVTKFKTLGFRATGRIAITSPNFSGCGGCLALVADNALNVTLINGVGTVATIATGLTATTGPQNAISVPTRVYGFGSSGGCLFGTVPSQDAIKEFPCTTPSPPTVFTNTSAGDLLIFTQSETVVRVKASDRSILKVHENADVYHDLAFSPLRRVKKVVVQPSVANPNLGPRGHIVFRFPPSPGFDPANDVNRASLKFGATGGENSVFKCEAVMGDGTLQCLADARVANCNGPILCIVTGFTFNQTGFDG